MYGNSGNNYRKYVKSVERKIPNDKRKYMKVSLQQNQIVSQNNSKLSSSYQLNPIVDFVRKSSGGTLNNSILSAINIYDSASNINNSSENLRFKNNKRNLNSSQNSKYHQNSQFQVDIRGAGNSSHRKRVSSKNLRARYQNQAVLMRSI